jgi:DNA-directed RNA polymerase subunit RPC12/RpoP
MISEKDLTKTKFYTTNGSDIWKVKAVRTFTLVELENCDTKGKASARVGEKSPGGFLPVIMPKVISATGARENKKTKKKAVKKKRRQKKDDISDESKKPSIKITRRGVRRGRKPSSQYFGVTVKTNKSGGKKYYAEIRCGKWVNLGCHNIEELAAAAVQEYLGNKEEASKLRKVAKEKIQEAIEATKDTTGYMCNGCGAGYKEQPTKCNHCGSGSFVKARKEKED